MIKHLSPCTNEQGFLPWKHSSSCGENNKEQGRAKSSLPVCWRQEYETSEQGLHLVCQPMFGGEDVATVLQIYPSKFSSKRCHLLSIPRHSFALAMLIGASRSLSPKNLEDKHWARTFPLFRKLVTCCASREIRFLLCSTCPNLTFSKCSNYSGGEVS